MKVTLKKIKILISSKQEAVLKRPEFYFQEIRIEIIKSVHLLWAHFYPFTEETGACWDTYK